jgi:predicted transglutaminase-like cysteine proteinase
MTTLLARVLRSVVAALTRIAAHLGPESPWDRVAMSVPTSAFGPGSRRHFAHYFEGESGVQVQSIDDVVEWLGQCEYATDVELFAETDLWQHPAAFEQTRRGDCEDFALWTWRKLAELGIDAELFVGRVVYDEELTIDRQHAWVVYRLDRVDYLFEPAAGNRQLMIRALEEVRHAYVPHFAVNRRFATSAFVGCILDSYRDKQRRRNPTRAA